MQVEIKNTQYYKVKSKNPSVKYTDLFENLFYNNFYDFKIIRYIFKKMFKVKIEILDDIEN